MDFLFVVDFLFQFVTSIWKVVVKDDPKKKLHRSPRVE